MIWVLLVFIVLVCLLLTWDLRTDQSGAPSTPSFLTPPKYCRLTRPRNCIYWSYVPPNTTALRIPPMPVPEAVVLRGSTVLSERPGNGEKCKSGREECVTVSEQIKAVKYEVRSGLAGINMACLLLALIELDQGGLWLAVTWHVQLIQKSSLL